MKDSTIMNFNRRLTIEPSEDSSLDLRFDTDEQDEYETILIVDDEEVVRNFHVDCLSGEYTCLEAASGEEALEILKARRVSIVITDWVMNGMSGTMLTRQIVSDYPDTVVIMVSGIDHPERIIDSIHCGAFDYLLKPFDPNRLEFAVRRAVKHRRLAVQARRSRIDLELQNIELTKQKNRLENLQSRIVVSEKMAAVGQLTAGIAHDLNNPLGYVSGNVQLLRQYFRELQSLFKFYEAIYLPPEIEESKARVSVEKIFENAASSLDDCEAGTRRMCAMIENLRSFSKLDQPEFSETEINRDIDSAIELLKRHFERDNVKLFLDYEKLPKIKAFAGHLNQVWMNLLLNALGALGDRGGDITIRTRVEGKFIRVDVEDSGVAGQYVEQYDNARMIFPALSVNSGASPGLPAIRAILERHQGTLEVCDSDFGGTIVSVRLPVGFNNIEFFPGIMKEKCP